MKRRHTKWKPVKPRKRKRFHIETSLYKLDLVKRKNPDFVNSSHKSIWSRIRSMLTFRSSASEEM